MFFDSMYEETKTLDDLYMEIGQEAIFENTDVDEATQNLILDWLFDYKLCTDDDRKFLKYFQRRLNMTYPMYLSQVRVMSIRENLDPFVQHYLEKVEKRNSVGSEASSKSLSGTASKTTDGETTNTDNTVRTPDLMTDTTVDEDRVNTHSDTESNVRTADLTHLTEYDTHDDTMSSDQSGSTRTPNLTQTTEYGGIVDDTKTGSNAGSRVQNLNDHSIHGGYTTDAGTSSSSSTDSNTDSSVSNSDASSSSTTYSDSFAISYPEANIGQGGNLSLDLGPNAGSTRSIIYAQSEALGGSKSDSTADNDTTTTSNHSGASATNGTTGNRHDVNTNDDTTHTGSESTMGSTSDTGHQEHSGQDTVTSTGTERTDATASGAVASSHTGEDTTHETGTDSTDRNANGGSTDSLDGTTNVHQTGTETTAHAGAVKNSVTESNENDQNEIGTASRTNDDTLQGVEKGRDESVADIIPRVMKALQNTNELKWFIQSLEVCFDCYS